MTELVFIEGNMLVLCGGYQITFVLEFVRNYAAQFEETQVIVIINKVITF